MEKNGKKGHVILTSDIEFDPVRASVRCLRTDLTDIRRFVRRIHVVDNQAPFVHSLVVVDTDSPVRHKRKHPDSKRMLVAVPPPHHLHENVICKHAFRHLQERWWKF